MKTIAFLMTTFVSGVGSAQETPTTGYAPVNGLKMYYEVHGSGDPVVLLHGAFMAITNNWTGWIGELSKTRKVIAVEMQGVAEMIRLKGGEIHGDLKPRSASRLAILPNTTHVTLMRRMSVIVPMVNDFLDAKP